MKFEEEKLKELKADYPTLKMSQLKERVWKEVSFIMRILHNIYSGEKALLIH